MATDTHIKGLSQLQALLDQLPAKIEANIMRGALRAGARVIQAEAKAKAPKKSGLLIKGIKVSGRLRQGVASATVKTTGKHAYLAPWLEFGTAAHKIVPKGGKVLMIGAVFVSGVDHPGAKPKPFMRPAVESKQTEAVLAVGAYVKGRLTKEGIDQASEVTLEVDE